MDLVRFGTRAGFGNDGGTFANSRTADEIGRKTLELLADAYTPKKAP